MLPHSSEKLPTMSHYDNRKAPNAGHSKDRKGFSFSTLHEKNNKGFLAQQCLANFLNKSSLRLPPLVRHPGKPEAELGWMMSAGLCQGVSLSGLYSSPQH